MFEVGAGSDASGAPGFAPLDEHGHLTLHRGPQGGYHVYAQVRMAGLDPVRLSLTRTLFDPTDTVRDRATALRFQPQQPQLYCDNDADWLLGEEQLTYVCPSMVRGQAMAGRDLLLRVEATDAEGRTRTIEHLIHPDCPPGDDVCAGDTTVGCAAP